MGFPGGSDSKESAAMHETQLQSLGQEEPLEKEIATHSSILAWGILWTEGRGSLWFTGHKDSDTTEELRLSNLSQNDFLST